jgi:hypothetical protein
MKQKNARESFFIPCSVFRQMPSMIKTFNTKDMKNLYSIIAALACTAGTAFGQTATGSFTQPPCNNDGIYSVTTNGIPLPITFTYYVNGSVIVHANVNSTSDQLTNIPMFNWGYISCQATGGGVSDYTEDSFSPSFAFEVFSTNAICPSTTGTIHASQFSGTPGPFSFTWTNEQTQAVYSGNDAAVPVGDYSGEIMDLTTGCVLQLDDSLQGISVYQTSDITAAISTTNANCTNGTATAVVSGGVAPYSYLWANGATGSSISGLSQGGYSLVITDAQGCQSNGLIAYVEQTPQIYVNTTVTDANCVQPDGSAIAFGSGGTGPYTYVWSNGQTGNTASSLPGDQSYTVVATDVNGCVGQGYAFITTFSPVNVSYASVPSQCTAPTGSATLTVTGGTAPYTYLWLSNPSVNGPVLSNVAPGNYSFKVTDATGCIRTGTVNVAPVSTIYANATASPVICPATTGTVAASVSGSNAPFTFSWSNGATTPSISGVPLGGYACTITDALGCSVTKYANLSSISPVNVSVPTTPVSCIYNTDGAASPIVSGGTAPYSYSYSNGMTTAAATNLGTGSYYLTVTDANGCSTPEHFWIVNGNTSQDCYCTISGTAFTDADGDCTYDSGENGIENMMIHCSGFGYTFTDANGHYSFQVPTGTYTISEQVNQYYPLSACQSNNISVSVVAASGCNTNVDFSNDINELHDLKIVTISSTIPPVPGNSYQQKVIVKNEGTVTESGIQLGYKHDSQIPFVSSTMPSFTLMNSAFPYSYGVQSGFPSLAPNGDAVMILDFYTPTSVPMGTAVYFYDSVAHMAPIDASWLLDNTPWNNVNTYQTTVVSSYDPNFKEVSPKGQGDEGYVSTDVKEFDYTIHFQNEGTYYAQNIVVTDQLDSDLDWTTFRPGYSDYEYSTTISETGLVTFTFAGINLPWKESFGDALSSAFVNYSIQRRMDVPVGTEFTNSASIYFDYNAPIITNTTVNTLTNSLGVEEVASANGDGVTMDLFPVPASDNLTFRVANIAKGETASISVLDLTGKIFLSEKIALNAGSTDITKDLSNLTSGTYLARIEFANGSSIVKKIVMVGR